MPHRSILTSWKEIARYVGKSVRTVQRWERESGFPVRRAKPGRKSSLLALPREIDLWVQSQRLSGERAGSEELERTTGMPCEHARMRSVMLFLQHPTGPGQPRRVVLAVSCDRCGAKFRFTDGPGLLRFNGDRTELSVGIAETS